MVAREQGRRPASPVVVYNMEGYAHVFSSTHTSVVPIEKGFLALTPSRKIFGPT